MYIVEFENNLGTRREIARVKTIPEIYENIYTFLKAHNYISYYTRTYTNPVGETVYDVGSHTEFFYSKEVPDNAIK